MKSKVILFLSAVIIFSFVSCQKESSGIKIGISKIVQHPALDAVEQAIQDELAAQGVTDVSYDLQNANGDVNTASTIANKFKAEKVDIAIGIATPTAVALANAIKDRPVIYAAVTDPVSANLVESFNKGGDNVTGVSDMTPVKEQIMMLNRIKPLKALGHVYTSSETNAVILAEMAKEACEELGIEFIGSTVSNSAEIKQAAQSIIDKVDGIYVSTDNNVVSALASLTEVALKNNVPIMSADPSSAETFDILIAWGFDYYKMGRATGRLVKEIIDGKKTSQIPTVFMTDPSDIDLLVNLDLAKKLGLTIPQDIIDNASKIVENGIVKKN